MTYSDHRSKTSAQDEIINHLSNNGLTQPEPSGSGLCRGALSMKQPKFPWHPPPTISQRMAAYRAIRFVRPGARSPLPEDIQKKGMKQ